MSVPQNETTTIEGDVLGYREIHELPGDWGPEPLLRLLADLEVDPEGTAEADLPDLALMALGDLESDEAAAAVLRIVFGETMGAGVRTNLAADLEDDRPWENFADLARQKGIFTACVLLQRAFPRQYGKPDAAWAEVSFRAPTEAAAIHLAAAPAAVILRALTPGFGSRSIVARLYDAGLSGGPFPEAEQILWRREVRVDPDDPCRVLAEIYGAQSFLGALDEATSWQANVKLPTTG